MDPLTLLLAASVSTLIGVIAGIATGLIPRLHVNKMGCTTDQDAAANIRDSRSSALREMD